MRRALVRWIDANKNGAFVYPNGRTTADAARDGTLFTLHRYCPPGCATPEEVLTGYGRIFGAVAYAAVSLADVQRVTL